MNTNEAGFLSVVVMAVVAIIALVILKDRIKRIIVKLFATFWIFRLFRLSARARMIRLSQMTPRLRPASDVSLSYCARASCRTISIASVVLLGKDLRPTCVSTGVNRHATLVVESPLGSMETCSFRSHC